MVTSTAQNDVFGELATGVQTLLSEHATFNVDRKAGLLQVTDLPERLDRVAVYLDAVQDRLQRQAQIDARIVEVELKDEKATGVDWSAVSTHLNSPPAPPAPRPAARPSLTGLRVTDAAKLLEALDAQGAVRTIASTRLLTLNNEPSIVRSEHVAFTVTPQIASDAVVTLSLSPIVAEPSVAEADMLARVADGETLVISGFMRDREVEERKTTASGRGTGWFGHGTVTVKKHVELIILLTPKIVPGAAAQ